MSSRKRPEHLKSDAARKVAEQRGKKPDPRKSKKFDGPNKHGDGRERRGQPTRAR